MSNFDHLNVKAVFCGLTQTAVVCAEGKMHSWGMSLTLNQPSHTPETTSLAGVIKSIVFGPTHCAVLLRNLHQRSEVWTWGSSSAGQLGHPLPASSSPSSEFRCELPRLVDALAHEEICQLTSSQNHTVALTTSGIVYIWGKNTDNFFGLPPPVPDVVPLPIRVKCPALFQTVCTGSDFTLALSRTGEVYSWGRSTNGCLGLDEITTAQRPTRLWLSGVLGIHCSVAHCFAWTLDGSVYAWGKGDRGQLGFAAQKAATPTIVKLENKNVLQISCASRFTLARLGWPLATVYHSQAEEGVLSYQTVNLHHYPTAEQLLSNVALYWRFDPEDYTLLDCFGLPLRGNTILRLFIEHQPHPFLFIVRTRALQLDNEADPDPAFVLEASTSHHTTTTTTTSPLSHSTATSSSPPSSRKRQTLPALAALPNITNFLPTRRTSRADILPERGLSNATNLGKNEMPGRPSFATPSSKSSSKSSVDIAALRPQGYSSKEGIRIAPALSEQSVTEFPLVRTATVERLVDWLTSVWYTGDFFRHAFFLSYQSFGLSSSDLLHLLSVRYKTPDSEIIPFEVPKVAIEKVGKSAQQPHRLRVIEVLAFWVQFHRGHFLNPDARSIDLISKTIKFIDRCVAPDFPRCADRLRDLLITHLDPALQDRSLARRLKFCQGAEPCDPAQHDGPIDIFKYTPREVARQLTLIDYFDYFFHIDPSEFTEKRWTRADKDQLAPNIVRNIQRFNNLSEWIAAEILKAESHTLRVLTTEVFIEIAEQLVLLSNFNTVLAVFSAFNSAAVHRLVSIWQPVTGSLKGISSRARASFDAISETISRNRNSAALRASYNNAPFPKLPYLGMYLTDLVFTDDGLADFTDPDKKLVNFSKFSTLSRLILELTRCQANPYQITPQYDLLDWLAAVRGFQNHADSAWALSRSIEGPDASAVVVMPEAQDVAEAYASIDQKMMPSEDLEVAVLNSRAELVFGNTEMFDRSKEWRSWLRSLSIKQGHCAPFKALILRSLALEETAVSIIKHPLTSSEEQLATHLFTECLPGVSVDQLLRVLSDLSGVRPTEEHLGAVRSLIHSLKSALPPLSTVDRPEMDARLLALRTLDSYAGSLLLSNAQPAPDADPDELIGKISEAKSHLDFFQASLQQSLPVQYAAKAELEELSHTEALDHLCYHLTNIRKISQDRIQSLAQSKDAALKDAQLSISQYSEQEAVLQAEKAELEREKAELEKRLRAVNRQLKDRNSALSSLARKKRGAAKARDRTVKKLDLGTAQETDFLNTRSDTIDAVAQTFRGFLDAYLTPHIRSLERLKASASDYSRLLQTGFFSAMATMLDFELILSSSIARQLMSVHQTVRDHRIFFLKHMSGTQENPQFLTPYLTIEERYLSILDQSRTRTHSLHTALLQISSPENQPNHSPSEGPSLRVSGTFLQESTFESDIKQKIGALDKIYIACFNCLPSLSALEQR